MHPCFTGRPDKTLLRPFGATNTNVTPNMRGYKPTASCRGVFVLSQCEARVKD